MFRAAWETLIAAIMAPAYSVENTVKSLRVTLEAHKDKEEATQSVQAYKFEESMTDIAAKDVTAKSPIAGIRECLEADLPALEIEANLFLEAAIFRETKFATFQKMLRTWVQEAVKNKRAASSKTEYPFTKFQKDFNAVENKNGRTACAAMAHGLLMHINEVGDKAYDDLDISIGERSKLVTEIKLDWSKAMVFEKT